MYNYKYYNNLLFDSCPLRSNSQLITQTEWDTSLHHLETLQYIIDGFSKHSSPTNSWNVCELLLFQFFYRLGVRQYLHVLSRLGFYTTTYTIINIVTSVYMTLLPVNSQQHLEIQFSMNLNLKSQLDYSWSNRWDWSWTIV